MAKPTFKAAGTAVQSNTSPVAVQNDVSPAAGDFLLMVVTMSGGSALTAVATPNAGDGWTAMPGGHATDAGHFDATVDPGATTAYRMALFYKIATGSEPSTYSVATVNSANTVGRVYAYASPDTSTPFGGVTPVWAASSTSPGNIIEFRNSADSPAANNLSGLTTDHLVIRVGTAHAGTTAVTLQVVADANHNLRGGTHTTPTQSRPTGVMDVPVATAGTDPASAFAEGSYGLQRTDTANNFSSVIGVSFALKGVSGAGGPPTEDLVPSGAPTTQTGLTGAYTAIDDPTDPALDDGDWMTGTDPSGTAGTTQNHAAQDPDTPSQAVTGFTATTLTSEANIFDTSDATAATHAPGTNGVDYGRYFQFNAADFSGIPSDATINSIAVRVRAGTSNANRLSLWMQVMAANGGTVIGQEGQTDGGTALPTTVQDYGANTSPALNAVPTRAQLVSGTFGVRLRWRRTNTVTLSLYRIQVTVNYTTAGTPGSTTATEVIVPLSDPSTITPDAAANGTLKMLVRKLGNGITGGNPTVIGELREGTTVRGSISSQTVSGEHEFTALVDQSTIVDWTNLNFRMRSNGVSGALVELGAARFVATGTSAPTTSRVSKDVDLRWKVAAPPVTPVVTNRMVGAVTDSGFAASAKVTGGTGVAWRLRVSTASDLSSPVFSSVVNANANGSLKASISGLSANTQYYYGWEADGTNVASGQGEAKTLPTDGSAASFRVVAASCVDNDENPTAMSYVAGLTGANKPVLHVMLGDMHYEDGRDAAGILTEAGRRGHLDNLLSFSNQASIYSKIPFVYMWSDHDYLGNGSYPGTSPSGNTAAQNVYRERMPHYPLQTSDGLYHAKRIGRVWFIFLDGRSYRTVHTATDNTSKTMLGATQKAWFKQFLLDHPDEAKVVTVENTWHSSISTADGWSRYNTERTELADFFSTNNIKNLLILHGDMHAIAADDGTNVPTARGGPMVKVFCASPWHQSSSWKITDGVDVYQRGPEPADGVANTERFGLIDIADSGGANIGVTLSAKTNTGADAWTPLTFNFTNVAGPTTSRVTKDVDLRWRVYTTVSKDVDLRWRTYAKTSKDVDLRWRTYAKTSKDVDLRWRTYAKTSKDADFRWRTYARVSKDVDLRWKVAGRVSKDVDLRWRTQALKNTDVRLTFQLPPDDLVEGANLQEFRIEVRKVGSGINPLLTAQLYENGTQLAELITDQPIPDTSEVFSALWDAVLLSDITGAGVELRVLIEGATDGYGELVDVEWNATHLSTPTTRVSKDVEFRWKTGARIQKDTELQWRVYQKVSQDVDLRWRTEGALARVQKDVDFRWRTYATVSKDVDLRWRTYARTSKDVDLRWRTYVTVSKSVDLRWRVYATVSKDVDLRWKVAGRVQKDVEFRWRVYTTVSQSVDLRWRVYAKTSKDVDLRWRTYARVSKDVDLRWVVLGVPGRVNKDVEFRWRTRALVSKDVDFRWRTYATVSKSVDLRWRVYTTVQKDVELRWRTLALTTSRVQKDVDLRWRTLALVSKDVELRWRVLSDELVVIVEGRVKPKVYAEGQVKGKIQAMWEVEPKIYAEGTVKPKVHATGQVRPD